MLEDLMRRTLGRLSPVVVAGLLVVGVVAGCSSDSGSAPGLPAAPASAEAEAVAVADDTGTSTTTVVVVRQTIQTGTITLAAKKPVDAATLVEALVKEQGAAARVDYRNEVTTSNKDDTSATLRVRVPASNLDAVIDGLRNMGDDVEIASLWVSEEDTTATAIARSVIASKNRTEPGYGARPSARKRR
jgi:hypothetical protein